MKKRVLGALLAAVMLLGMWPTAAWAATPMVGEYDEIAEIPPEEPEMAIDKPVVSLEDPVAAIEKPATSLEEPEAAIAKPVVSPEKPEDADELPTAAGGTRGSVPAASAEPAVDEGLLIQIAEPDEALYGEGYSALLTVPGDWDSYDWQVWRGEAEGGWVSLGTGDPMLPLSKEMFTSRAFRCVVTRDGARVATAPYAYDEAALTAPASAQASLFWGEANFLTPWKQTDYIAVADARFNDRCFDIYGRESESYYKTTFKNGGYYVASEVDGTKVSWNVDRDTNMSMGGSLTGRFSCDTVYGGRYVKITYQVTNNGSTEKAFKVGSAADVMIDQNDRAEVVGTSMGLQMDDGDGKLFNLVAPTATTKWFGHYSGAYANIFTAMSETALATPYNKDSGMAWSWADTVEPGKTWTRYALIGVGELPEPLPAPVIHIQLEDGRSFVTPSEVFPVSGSATPGSVVYIDVGGREYTATVTADGSFSSEVTVPEDAAEGPLEVRAWAVNEETGAISDTVSETVSVVHAPYLTLTADETSVEEEQNLDESWYQSFIKSTNGTVTYTAIHTDTPGDKIVTYAASLSTLDPAEKALTVHILPKPAKLGATTAEDGGGAYTLSSTMEYTGGLNYTETGFVYAAFQNPSLSLRDGVVTTASPVNTKGGGLAASLPEDRLAEGVTYYARAYAKTADGAVIYAPQSAGFGLGVPLYGAFSVTNNSDSTFTVSRVGGSDGAQKVYVRTVNGSAVGETHFAHKDAVLTFPAGNSDAQTVSVAENAVTSVYGGKSATAWSNAERTYQLEIYRVEGGATVSDRAATRVMDKDTSYTVDRNCFVAKKEAISKENNKSSNNGDTTPSYADAFAMNRFYTQYVPYLKETAYRYEMHMHAYVGEWEDCWEWMRFTSGDENATIKFEIKPDANLNDWTDGWFPRVVTTTENNIHIAAVTGNRAVYESQMGLDRVYRLDITTSPITVAIAATGSGPNNWDLGGYEQESVYSDIQEPQLLGVAPMAGGTYLPGDPVTISLIFDEIVDSANSKAAGLTVGSSCITTSWGQFTYAGGADTNVLYFTGTMPNSGAASPITLKSLDCADSIKDMCNYAGTQSGYTDSPSAVVTAGSLPAPTVTVGAISNNSGVLGAEVTVTGAVTAEYAWSGSADRPATGWVKFAQSAGGTVSTRKGSGTWYLHARGTNAEGCVVYAQASITIPEPAAGQPEPGTPPELTASLDNTNWAVSRTITLTKTPGDAAVTVKTPAGGTAEVNGSSYTAEANGVYAFTLASGGETVTAMATVSRLDWNAPTVSIDPLPDVTYVQPVTLTVRAADGESGLAEITGTWSKSGGGSQSATFADKGEGVYTAVSPDETGVWTLSVTAKDNVDRTASAASAAYVLNLNVPTVAVTQGTTNANGSVNYTYEVEMNGQTVQAVQLPDGAVTTALTGSFVLTAPGTYYMVVSDTAGHVARSEAMTVAQPAADQPAVDGEAPEVRLRQNTEDWVRPETGVDIAVSAFDNIAVTSATWSARGGGETAIALTTDAAVGVGEQAKTGAFHVSQNGVYTVTVRDERDNTAETTIEITNIDAAAPTVANLTGNPEDWTRDDAVITFTVTDAQSGVKTVTAAKDGTAVAVTDKGSGNYAFTATASGDHTVTVTDNVGNTATQTVRVTKIDKAAPAIAVSGGATAGASLELTVAATSSGPSGVTATAQKDGGAAEAVTGGKYTVTAAGSYVFTAATGAGRTASQTVDVYAITFDAQGGSAVDSQLVVSGGKVTQPTTARAGYTLSGWSSGTADWDFAADAVTAHTALAARWTLNAPSVTVTAAPENAAATYTGGPSVTLTAVPVHAAGGLTYTYQWYKGGAPLSGKNASTLDLTAVADSGEYTVKITASDGAQTADAESSAIPVTIRKAAPTSYPVPEDLTAAEGQTLADVALPTGWTWKDAALTVGEAGEQTFVAVYTPEDTGNYNAVEVTLTVAVAHSHSYGADWQSDATGHWHACDCGERADVEAHVSVTDEAVAATCTETGLTQGSHCEICGYVIAAQTETPLAEHTWDEGEVTTQPTCTEPGVKTYTCTVCTATKTEEIPATGHTYGEYQHDATGHWQTCSVCNTETTKEAHVFADDQDTTCDTCGYTRNVTPVEPDPVASDPVAPDPVKPDPVPDTYAISGTVVAGDGPAAGATVKLMQGNTQFGTTAITDTDGKFSFSNVEPGVYNIVAVKSGVTMTKLVAVEAADLTNQTLTMPEGSVNSVLEVKGADTPDVVVGGLETEAESNKETGSTVTVTMSVETKDETADNAAEIKAAAGSRTVDFLEIKVEKTVTPDGGAAITSAITTTQSLMQIIIPFDLTGKENVVVYRYHGGRVDTLTATANGEGEYIVLGTDSITLYAKNFSTYAIGYTAVAAEPDPAPSQTPTSGRTTSRRTAAAVADAACPKDETCPIAQFTDADPAAWYHDGVHYCLETGLMVGTSETTFEPKTATSRAMIVTILWRQAGSPAVNYAMRYDDVAPDAWYTEAVRWASSVGVVKGYGNGKFGPGDPITREQLAAMLYRYAQATGRDVSVGEDTNILSYKDFDQIGEWAIPALQWAAGSGIVQGKGGGVLDPQGQATRAEAATMLQRFCGKEK